MIPVRSVTLLRRLSPLRSILVVALAAACASTTPANPSSAPPAPTAAATATSVVTPDPSSPPSETATPPATAAPSTAPPATASPSASPAATGASPTASPTADPGEASHLMEALALAPAGTRSLAFTDWSRIKASQGVPSLSSRDSLEARITFLRSIGAAEAASVGFGLRYLRRHASSWGWDTTDLAWEALIDHPEAPPAFVVRFPPGRSLEAVTAAYGGFGFTRSTHRGVTIHSTEQGLAAPWIGTTELAVRNTAVITDPPTLVMSTSLERVRALVDVYAGDDESLAGVAPVADLAVSLADASAVFLFPPPTACAQVGAVRGDGATAFGRYDAFAVGYRRSGESPAQGTIAMRYPSEADAAADAAAREEAARSGVSAVTQRPYAESVFTVQDARVEGAKVLLDLLPVDDRPRRLFDLVIQRDTTFAACD